MVAADKQLQRQAARVHAIDTEGLVPQLAAPVEQLQRKLSEPRRPSERASLAVRLLPPMLGSEGPRNYLVLFQNNAEIRATGGMPGALAVLRADHGRLSIVGQGTAGDLGFHQTPPLRLTRQETALYEKKLGMYAADLDFTPDFPRAAQIARAMWRASKGQTVDGVLSADPVALSYLLQGTGPVQVPGGPTLNASNAVDVLLSDIYRTQPDSDLQNAFFAASARSVFDAVASGKGDPVKVLGRPHPRRRGEPGLRLVGRAGRAGAPRGHRSRRRHPTRAGRARRTSASSSTTAPARRCSTTSSTTST